MGTSEENTPDEESREEIEDQAFDFWSDEGARLFNEILDEGSAYMSSDVRFSGDFKVYVEDDQFKYVATELYDPDLETLPPGEMELIFENSYVM